MKKFVAEALQNVAAIVIFVGVGGLVAPVSVVAGFKIAENVFPNFRDRVACVESETERDAETPVAVPPETLVAE